MTSENNTQSAIEAGKDIAATSQKVQFQGDIPFYFDHKGNAQILNGLLTEQDKRAMQPRRLSGAAKLTEEASFVLHINRFKDGQSVIFADGDKFLAVFDYNRTIPQGLTGTDVPGRNEFARWGSHRAEYAPPLSNEWKTWTEKAGTMMEQVAFADFLEANLADIAGPIDGRSVPSPADMYTTATKLKIFSNDTCESSIDRNTGEHTIVAKVENNPQGSSKIPREFDLLLAVFGGGDLLRLTCKFRLTKNGGIKFGFVIPDADRVRRAALLAVRERLSKETGLPIVAGSPEQ